MAKRVLAFQCKYCKKLFKSDYICVRHEKSCLKNPYAKNCLLCEQCAWDGVKHICMLKNRKCSKAVSSNCNNYKKREFGEIPILDEGEIIDEQKSDE